MSGNTHIWLLLPHTKTGSGDAPLWLAVFNQNLETAKMLIEEYEVDVAEVNRCLGYMNNQENGITLLSILLHKHLQCPCPVAFTSLGTE